MKKRHDKSLISFSIFPTVKEVNYFVAALDATPLARNCFLLGTINLPLTLLVNKTLRLALILMAPVVYTR